MMTTWIVKDKIKRAGETKNGLKIFWFKGLGYWVCPPGATLIKGGIDRWLIHTPLKEGGTKRLTGISCDPELLRDRLWTLVDLTEANHGLFEARVLPSDLKIKIHYKAPYRGALGYYYTRVIPALQPYLEKEIYKVKFARSISERNAAKLNVESFIESQYKLIDLHLKAKFSFKQFYPELPQF